LKLTPEKVAIELNKRLVRSDKYDTPLKAGDEVEIVTFVSGEAFEPFSLIIADGWNRLE
jgi:hypothetical protein